VVNFGFERERGRGERVVGGEGEEEVECAVAEGGGWGAEEGEFPDVEVASGGDYGVAGWGGGGEVGEFLLEGGVS